MTLNKSEKELKKMANLFSNLSSYEIIDTSLSSFYYLMQKCNEVHKVRREQCTANF